jgi:hypothetical protein
MNGGILLFGTTLSSSTSYCFTFINGTSPLIRISHVDIQFVNTTNSFIYVVGGAAVLEYVTIDEEKTRWVYPLIYADTTVSLISVELHWVNITNSVYKYSFTPSCAVVYFKHSSTSSSYAINLNITFSYFWNNSYDMGGSSNYCGVCAFLSYQSSSGIFDMYLFFYSLLFFFELSVFSVTGCIFMSTSYNSQYGGLFDYY